MKHNEKKIEKIFDVKFRLFNLVRGKSNMSGAQLA